jgi:hypothetical protein
MYAIAFSTCLWQALEVTGSPRGGRFTFNRFNYITTCRAIINPVFAQNVLPFIARFVFSCLLSSLLMIECQGESIACSQQKTRRSRSPRDIAPTLCSLVKFHYHCSRQMVFHATQFGPVRSEPYLVHPLVIWTARLGWSLWRMRRLHKDTAHDGLGVLQDSSSLHVHSQLILFFLLHSQVQCCVSILLELYPCLLLYLRIPIST